MSRYFSIISYGNQVTLAPGAVNFDSLVDFQPLLRLLATKETSETVSVVITHAWLIDNNPDRDLRDDEIPFLTDCFKELYESNCIREFETAKRKYNGVMDKPFEDYYNLQGKEREEYLKLKAERQKALASLRESLTQRGYTEEQIEEYIERNC